MAFNQGPQPEIVLNTQGVRYIDPNPTDEIVNHEDLVMYVKLVARTKGRSILTVDGDEATTLVEQNNRITNFTYPTGDRYLDTRWTNIGGGTLDIGEDVGAFGITNINIEFKSSFMPQIVIDFVDVRGATLFEQGPCSPYAAFFHLPYPVFELTVKGYYGKPVTYTLALVKFNTKFNAETGNFESRGEFVGYTYAFLADIPMGYVLASTYIKYPLNGKEVLKNKWTQLQQKINDPVNGLPAEALTVFDLIRNAKKLETELPTLKNSTNVKNLTSLNVVKTQLTSLKDSVEEFKRNYLINIGTNNIKETNGVKNTVYINVTDSDDTKTLLTKATDLTTEYFGDGTSEESFKSSLIGVKYELVLTYYTANNLTNPPEITLQKIKDNSAGFFGTAKDETKNPVVYSIDLYEGILKEINIALTKSEEELKKQRENVRLELNRRVTEILGFFPNIRNVFAIILTNVEVFLELLLKTSVEAEKYHESEDVTSGLNGETQKILDLKDKINGGPEVSDVNKEKIKVYPWPTYYEKTGSDVGTAGDPGSKEKFPGDNLNFISWPEVLFVEDFIRALTELAEDLSVLDLEVENLPGFDNFAPITPFETQAFGDDRAPNRWYDVAKGTSKGKTSLGFEENIYKTMGENAFLLGDYSMINSLTVWKSQLGFKNSWGPRLDNNYEYNTITDGPPRLTQNPTVTSNLSSNNQLNRYGGNGMFFEDENAGNAKLTFKEKIMPTTRARMEDWGYVDALNAMTTLGGQGDRVALTSMQRNLGTEATSDKKTEIKNKVISSLKKHHGDENILVQTFNSWKVDATTEIGGTSALIDQQNKIWEGHFTYVKSNNVLTLKGPIGLNDNSDISDTKISANPHENSNYGVRLVSSDDAQLTSRSIDFNKEILGEKTWLQYQQKYAYGISDSTSNNTEVDNTQLTTTEEENTSQSGNPVDQSQEQASKTTIASTLTKNRPKYTERGATAYSPKNLSKIDSKGYGVDKNLGILSMGTEFYRNFYHTYKNACTDLGSVDGKEDGTGNKNMWDLGSSRSIRKIKGDETKKEYTIEWSEFIGNGFREDRRVSDSIIQTPLWTLNYPLYKNPWYYDSDYGITNEEYNKEVTNVKNLDPSYRNKATWWGLNQWGIDNTSDIYKPLAYLAVMSFGLDNITPLCRTGHYPPFDGVTFEHLSSFCNFTHSAISVNLPKSYILLIGAILWRMKESGLLEYEQIKKTKNNDSNNKRPGWNFYDKSVSIDDLGDPVWFFHNPLSRSLGAGGTVPKEEIVIDNETVYKRTPEQKSNGLTRWSDSRGNGELAWLKANFDGTGIVVSNNNKGFFDQCRQDQVPFFMTTPSNSPKTVPKTLVLLDSSNSPKPLNTPTRPNLEFNSYPGIKESIKELMFLPASLKNDFINYFENWATNENGGASGWLTLLDKLNFGQTGIGNLWKSKSSNNNYVGDDQTKRNGWYGFVDKDIRNNNNYGKVPTDQEDPATKLFRTSYSISGDGQKQLGESGTIKSEGSGDFSGTDSSICFVTGTKIKLSNGKNKNIEDLLSTDKILSFNLNNNKIEESTISGVNLNYANDVITIILENNVKIECTSTHPFYVREKGFVSYKINNKLTEKGKIKQMVIGDKILYYDNNKLIDTPIKNIVVNIQKTRPVYDIKGISGNKTYIANNVLVHSTFN